MSEHRPAQRPSQYDRVDEKPTSGAAIGFTVFAGVMMIMAGCFQAFAGVVGIFENEFYVNTRNYVLQFDATTWGWIPCSSGCWSCSPASRCCPARPGPE